MEPEVVLVVEDDPYTICDKTFDVNASFETHMIQHNKTLEAYDDRSSKKILSIKKKESSFDPEQLDNPEHCCPICNKTYAKNYTLRMHMYKHSGDYPFTCEVCGMGRPSYSYLKKHLKNHRGGPHRCDVCNKIFSRKRTLKTHLLTHIIEKRYQCPVCKKLLQHRGSWKRHVLLHDKKRVVERLHQCTVCGKLFSGKPQLKEHALIHTGERPHQCEECGKTFTQLQTLRNHKRTHSNERPYKCSICERRYRHIGQLKIHIRRHTGERPFMCDVCGKGFFSITVMKRHIYFVHTGAKPFQCSNCNKAYTNSAKLVIHMRSHTKEKPYGCNLCDKHFSLKESLRNHLAVHSEERPYRCNKPYKKPFKCHLCNKSFHARVLLSKHIEVHKKTCYRCTVCNKGFADSVILSQHMSLHTKKPHLCIKCNKMYEKKYNLKKHMLKHHGITLGESESWNEPLSGNETKEIALDQSCENTNQNLFSKKIVIANETEEVPFMNYKAEADTKDETTGNISIPTSASSDNEAEPFYDESKLHILTHCGTRAHQCRICHNDFDEKESLRKHILTHSKAWAQQVTLDRLFSKSVNIQVIQTRENCYQCSVCKTTFATRENAMKHLLVHKHFGFLNLKRNLQRLVQTTHIVGDKLLADNGTLSKNMLKHSGKHLFKCILCDKLFVCRESLKKHVFTHVLWQ